MFVYLFPSRFSLNGRWIAEPPAQGRKNDRRRLFGLGGHRRPSRRTPPQARTRAAAQKPIRQVPPTISSSPHPPFFFFLVSSAQRLLLVLPDGVCSSIPKEMIRDSLLYYLWLLAFCGFNKSSWSDRCIFSILIYPSLFLFVALIRSNLLLWNPLIDVNLMHLGGWLLRFPSSYVVSVKFSGGSPKLLSEHLRELINIQRLT